MTVVYSRCCARRDREGFANQGLFALSVYAQLRNSETEITMALVREVLRPITKVGGGNLPDLFIQPGDAHTYRRHGVSLWTHQKLNAGDSYNSCMILPRVLQVLVMKISGTESGHTGLNSLA